MLYSLLGFLIVICAVVGHSLSAWQGNVWTLALYSIAAVTALQVAYLLSALAGALR